MISSFSSIPTFSSSHKPSVPSLQFGLKVAIVDDTPGMSKMLERSLPKHATLRDGDTWEFQTYTSVDELEEGIARERPDLIISDGRKILHSVVALAGLQEPPIPVICNTLNPENFQGRIPDPTMKKSNGEEEAEMKFVPVYSKDSITELAAGVTAFAQTYREDK